MTAPRFSAPAIRTLESYRTIFPAPACCWNSMNLTALSTSPAADLLASMFRMYSRFAPTMPNSANLAAILSICSN